MSKLAALDHLLQQYHAFEYHSNAMLAKRLTEVQDWLKARIAATHSVQFSQEKNQLMAAYFLNRLYGGPDFDSLALQIQRLVNYAHKAEKFLPETAILTGTKSVELAILAMQLDEQVTQQLLIDYPANIAIDDEMMRLTLLKVDQQQNRLKQLQLFNDLGQTFDKYMRSFVMHAAFKLCKNSAYKHQLQHMYDFIDEGFKAVKPIQSAAGFIAEFTAKEREIIDKVHQHHPHPFSVSI